MQSSQVLHCLPYYQVLIYPVNLSTPHSNYTRVKKQTCELIIYTTSNYRASKHVNIAVNLLERKCYRFI